MIFIVSCLGGVLGIGYAMIKKPLYTAKLSFALVEGKSGGGGGLAVLASQFGVDVGGNNGGVFEGENLLELMKSRLMLQKTLLSSVNVNGKNETLAELFINFNDFRKAWNNKPELKNINFLSNCDENKFSLKQDSVLDVFCESINKSILSVEKIDKKLNIVVVTAKSKNEIFSKYFVEYLVNNVSKFYTETKTQKYKQNVDILQHQTDSVRQVLNEAITGVASSVDISPNPNPNKMVLRTPSQHRQVDVQVNSAILGELVKNLEIARVSLRNETPLIQIIDRPILPLLVTKLSKVKMFTICFLSVLILTSVVLLMKKTLSEG